MGVLVKGGVVNGSLHEVRYATVNEIELVVRNAPWAPFPPAVNNVMIESINSGGSEQSDTC